MGKLGLIVGVLALALAAYGALELCAKDDEIAGLSSRNNDLLDRVTVLEAKLADASLTPPRPGLRTAAASEGTAADADAPALSGRVATPLDRLAALEKAVAKQDERLGEIRTLDATDEAAHARVRRSMNDRFYRNLDGAARSMELKDTQKEDLKDIQERALDELKNLYELENDEGTTWNEARKPKMLAAEGVSFVMPDMAKLNKFKKGRIPGSSETFGEAEKRIRKDAFGRMRNVLTDKQAEKWDKAHKDALLRGGSSFASVSFVGMDLPSPSGDR